MARLLSECQAGVYVCTIIGSSTPARRICLKTLGLRIAQHLSKSSTQALACRPSGETPRRRKQTILQHRSVKGLYWKTTPKTGSTILSARSSRDAIQDPVKRAPFLGWAMTTTSYSTDPPLMGSSICVWSGEFVEYPLSALPSKAKTFPTQIRLHRTLNTDCSLF